MLLQNENVRRNYIYKLLKRYKYKIKKKKKNKKKKIINKLV